MPEKFSPDTAGHSSNGSPFSLADLLPDLIERENAISPAQPEPSTGRAPLAAPRPENFSPAPAAVPRTPVVSGKAANPVSGPVLFGAVIVGLVAVPLLLVFLFANLVNSQPQLSSADIEKLAKTPLPTIVGITPTVPRTAGATATPLSNCPRTGVAGALEVFPCARTVPGSADWTNFLKPAESQLANEGHRPLGAARYDVVAEQSDKVIQYYDGLLNSKGFAPGQAGNAAAAKALGNTPLGSYQVVYYNNVRQQIQIAILTLNKAAQGGAARAGELVIRISAG